MIRALLPSPVNALLDVGSGPITPGYPYADRAEQITCLDWKLCQVEPIPAHVQGITGDFTTVELPRSHYDVIVVSDVFEHVQLEQEPAFIDRCQTLLPVGGTLVLSVPHQGTFAWLDPYDLKPRLQGILWRLGLYNQVHNGECDVRKGHQHYTQEDLSQKFQPLKLVEARYWGYVYDPLLSWVEGLSKRGLMPAELPWLNARCATEFERDYGTRAFNMALKFVKT
nr:class I SAM-dependent methyltransferase [Petrachloros mirabilis]